MKTHHQNNYKRLSVKNARFQATCSLYSYTTLNYCLKLNLSFDLSKTALIMHKSIMLK